MSCKPHDLYKLASAIVESTNPSEVELRCAVSRAYYAVFHSVVDAFPKREKQFRLDGESSHAEVIGRVAAFGASLEAGRTDAAVIAKLLPQLRRQRNNADYRFELDFEKPEVQNFVRKAKFVIEKCAAVKSAQKSSKLRTG